MKIEIRGLNELLYAFNKAGVEFPEVFRRAMTASVEGIWSDAKKNVPTDTHALSDSILKTVTYNPLIGKITVNQPYGKYVEYGTRPHWTSVHNVEDWARRKGIDPYLVVIGIARKGTKPHPFMKPALINNIDKVKKYFQQAVNETVRMLAGKK